MSDTYKNNDLTLEVEEKPDVIEIHFIGRSTDREPGTFLNPIFNELLDKNKKILMNFNKMEYMNSSTITPILKVLDKVKNTTREIKIIYPKDLRWLELTFSALEIFQTDDKRIEIVGA
ncbi:MAG: hypothetical protein OEZ13_10805 [Spirochaetia bacterium]|nr:hypothetical protein [Spirochaetia bacterium]